MKSAVIAATGLYTPPQSVSNAELVAAFNAYVDLHNTENADAILAGDAVALIPSSEAFIEKASGIKSRYVVEKSGVIDPTLMRPRLSRNGRTKRSRSWPRSASRRRATRWSAGVRVLSGSMR